MASVILTSIKPDKVIFGFGMNQVYLQNVGKTQMIKKTAAYLLQCVMAFYLYDIWEIFNADANNWKFR